MSEEMKKNIDDAELNREQLEDAAGGIIIPDKLPDFPQLPKTKYVTCWKCLTVMEVPISKLEIITCTGCGASVRG